MKPQSEKRTSFEHEMIPSAIMGILAIGSLFSPPVALGIRVGAGLTLLELATTLPDPKERIRIKDGPVHGCLSSPVLEELLFRSVLQERVVPYVLIRTAGSLIPVRRIEIISLLFSSAAFGAAHFTGSGSERRVIYAAAWGTVFGLLYQKGGLPASFTAHCFHNSLVRSFLYTV